MKQKIYPGVLEQNVHGGIVYNDIIKIITEYIKGYVIECNNQICASTQSKEVVIKNYIHFRGKLCDKFYKYYIFVQKFHAVSNVTCLTCVMEDNSKRTTKGKSCTRFWVDTWRETVVELSTVFPSCRCNNTKTFHSSASCWKTTYIASYCVYWPFEKKRTPIWWYIIRNQYQ